MLPKSLTGNLGHNRHKTTYLAFLHTTAGADGIYKEIYFLIAEPYGKLKFLSFQGPYLPGVKLP
jgi:hypothetical protein